MKYDIKIKDQGLIIFDTVDLTPDQVKKLKKDPNVLNLKPTKKGNS